MELRENNIPALLLNFHRLGLYHAFITHLLPGVPVTGEEMYWHTQQGHFLFFSWCLWAKIGQREDQREGNLLCGQEAGWGQEKEERLKDKTFFYPIALCNGTLWAQKASPTREDATVSLRHAWVDHRSVRACD